MSTPRKPHKNISRQNPGKGTPFMEKHTDALDYVKIRWDCMTGKEAKNEKIFLVYS